ncbi:MAG: rhodanese-like domain-containing protein [Magnetococcales bacterium]|nr:rhodanese-like domain-containing protein [Magnetococcales bacterium]
MPVLSRWLPVLVAGLSLWGGELLALDVNITKEIPSITVKHGNKTVTVQRNQDPAATLDPEFAKISRKCPPFCAHPLEAAAGVKTVGEVELIHFMNKELKDGTGILVDARTPDWHAKGTIPGSINVPHTDLSPEGADAKTLEETMKRFGVSKQGAGWDFSKAKNLAMWCNGAWCGQSPTAIQNLLKMGYPANKLFYYHGGMQSWKMFGLTVVPPAE